MNKKVFIGIIVLVLCILVTGCFKEKEKPFTMICTTEKEKSGGSEFQTSVTYQFNKKQIVTEYSSVTTEKFNDKDTYETYKKSQIEMVSGEQTEFLSYSLEQYDDELKLVFIMELTNIDKNSKTKEEKEAIKAKTILEKNENNNAKCTLEGISRKQIK